MEIQPKKPEFPQLVCDVLADVGDGPVGTDDDLLVVLELLARPRRSGLVGPPVS